ncbi:MAG: family 43 glycosylhydrolase [Phycisphaerae bacterium]|nr:family 43 glycosylhydrolase [Phycisphaerae bacterium]
MQKKHLLILIALFMSIITFGSQSNDTDQSITLSYANPVWDGYFADPHVTFANGYYYAYGTGQVEDGKQFPVLRSRDFTSWEFVGGALEPLKEPAMNDYWAPEVAEHNGKYYLYYSGDMKQRVAVADCPQGPFVDTGKLMFPELEFSIDGHPFKDPVSGKWYLFFAKDFFDKRPGTALAVVELADDMISVKSPVYTVIRAFSDWQIYQRNRHWYDKDWPAWHTLEGAAVVYRDGKYYCFYSGGNWQTPGYGVGCGVSDTITGPYVDQWSNDGASVLSTIEDKLIGPGHNSVILGPDKKTYFIVYHSWNTQRTARQMCIDPIVWTADGPKAYKPSRGKKQVTIPLAESANTDYKNEIESHAFDATFVNPVYEGADPFIYKHSDGLYYFCQSEGDKGIAVWKSDKLTDKGVKKVVWHAPKTGWNTSDVWAPEIHFINGKWYIYYAADDGNNINHLSGVLQSTTNVPQGDYIDKGILYTGDDIDTKDDNRWAIDATPLEMNGKLYLIWSGWKDMHDRQSLYIAEMKNPWTIKTNRVKLADNDDYTWEKISDNPDQKGLHEGPQILKNNGKVYVIYSCSGSWETTYKLAQLSIDDNADPMNSKNWVKKATPVFTGTKTVHGVGHASFTTSPDGKENWIVYHSKISTRPGWERNVRMQKFGFNADGSPDFGQAIDAGVPLKKPSGEKSAISGKYFKDTFDNDSWQNWCYYGHNRFVDAIEGKFILGINPGWGIANNYRSGEKAIIRDFVWDDFTIQAKVKVVKGNRDAGLIFRVRHPSVGYDALKGYFAGIIPNSKKAVLGKMDGASWHELALKGYPCQENIWYDIKVIADKDLIKMFVNGTLVIEARDNSFTKGFAGIRVVDTHAEFDDVIISAK